MARGFPVLLFAAVAIVWSCDGGIDGDADIDSDGDGDGGCDSDCGSLDADTPPPHGDADADRDREWDVVPLVAEALCLDGADESREAFADCETLECLSAPGCCLDVAGSWVSGDFSACASPPDCGWTAFPAGQGGYEMDPPWVDLVAVASGGESGLYTAAVVEARGEVVLTFAASLDPAGCPAAGCRQRLGVAITAQDRISGATGIEPAAAIVLDGDHGTVRYVVDGQIEPDPSEAPFEDLIAPRGYAMRLRTDGRLEFWAGLELDSSATAPTVVIEGEPSLVSSRALAVGGARLRVALFAQLSGEGRGQVGAVRLERPRCDVPDGFVAAGGSPVVTPSSSTDRVGGPAVIVRPTGGLLMVYEAGHQMLVTSSTDGDVWSSAAAVLPETAPTPYGRVARRAPTLAFLDASSAWPGYHLWFEAESPHRGTLVDGQPRFAILHATSPDGVVWVEADGEASIAVTGSAERRWMSEVGQPSVVPLGDGTLAMFFTGRSGTTGETRIGLATSLDGRSWHVGDAPVDFGDGTPLAFERDGVSHPAALRRGTAIHLWYTGTDGARESIGYAVGVPGVGNVQRWERFGRVLGPDATWEGERVLAPAVAVLPAPGASVPVELGEGVVRLWYEAGMPGRERIGSASREIPARIRYWR